MVQTYLAVQWPSLLRTKADELFCETPYQKQRCPQSGLAPRRAGASGPTKGLRGWRPGAAGASQQERAGDSASEAPPPRSCAVRWCVSHRADPRLTSGVFPWTVCPSAADTTARTNGRTAYYFLTIPEAGGRQGWLLPRPLSMLHWWSPSPCDLTCPLLCPNLLSDDTSHMRLTPTPMTSFQLNYHFKDPVIKYSHIRGRLHNSATQIVTFV